MSARRRIFPAMLALASALTAAPARIVNLAWDEFPPLPPSAGQTRQPGVASPFVGVHRDALIVAGGANFPDGMPWEGGAKVWWDDIWVLEKAAGGRARWVTEKRFKLPRRLGYGVAVSTSDGVLCAGGSDADRCYADVFLLSWDPRAREIRQTPFPPLPEPLANMAGALVDGVFYVAGGQHVMKGAAPSSVFWALDLSKRGRKEAFKWTILPTWPGPARVLPVAAAQRAANGGAFFLFSGRTPRAGLPTEMLRDAYAFDPKSRAWRTLAKINGGAGLSVMAGTAAPVGDDQIFVFGGDRGELFLELEAHDLAIEALRRRMESAAADARGTFQREIDGRLAAKRTIYGSHPGFGREVFAFDTGRDTWRVVARAPETTTPQVTTTAVVWDGAIVIPSGEIRPGVRTPSIVRVKPVMRQP